MKRPSRRSQIALLCGLLVVLSFSIFAHRVVITGRQTGPAKTVSPPNRAAAKIAVPAGITPSPAQSGGG